MVPVKQLLAEKSSAELYSVAPDAPVIEAIKLMADKHCGALVVLENERLVGIVSERDYARKVILQGRSSKDTPVRDIMTAKVITVTLDDRAYACMNFMNQHKIRHLPVVDGERVVGMLSIGDLVRAVIADQQTRIQQLESYIQS